MGQGNEDEVGRNQVSQNLKAMEFIPSKRSDVGWYAGDVTLLDVELYFEYLSISLAVLVLAMQVGSSL